MPQAAGALPIAPEDLATLRSWSAATHAPAPAGPGLARQASPRPPALHPTDGSWRNLVEMFVSIVERQALRRRDFASVNELVAAIRRFCDGWNQRCQSFPWIKDADQILAKLKPPPTAGNDS